jgi:hypothetical protein
MPCHPVILWVFHHVLPVIMKKYLLDVFVVLCVDRSGTGNLLSEHGLHFRYIMTGIDSSRYDLCFTIRLCVTAVRTEKTGIQYRYRAGYGYYYYGTQGTKK